MSLDEAALRSFLVNELGVNASDAGFDDLLFSTGVIDSFALVTLMTYIENETGHLIPPIDITLENFDSISRMIVYLKRAETSV